MPNNVTARMVYENAKATLLNYWINDSRFAGNPEAARAFVDTMRLTQSYLRLELATAVTIANYNFAVTQQQKGGGVVFPTEQFLNLQDSFVCNEIAAFIGLFTGPTSGVAKLKTFMNRQDANDVAMNAWWTEGVLSLRINNEVILPAWELWRSFYVPQTQDDGADIQDQIRGAEDALYPVEPNILLIGSKNNQLTVTLPEPLSAVTADSRVVILCRGVLAQNSTVVS